MEPEERCREKISGTGQWGSFHPTQCTRKATVNRAGKGYCKIHDPEYRLKKSKEQANKYREQMATKRKQWALEKAAPAMLEALKNLVSRIDEGLAIGEALDLKPAREAIAEAEEKDV